jgi:hypothetical protein
VCIRVRDAELLAFTRLGRARTQTPAAFSECATGFTFAESSPQATKGDPTGVEKRVHSTPAGRLETPLDGALQEWLLWRLRI